jgi:Bacterial Ig domain
MQLLRSWGRLLCLSLFSLAPLVARADVLVYVTMFSLTPDPVTISVGESVFWTDGDGGGPYGIYGLSGWSTETDSYGIQFNQAGTYNYYDDNGNYGTIYVRSTANLPPFVSITAPTDNAVFTPPANFAFTADAFDPDADGILDVQFYVGGTLVDDVYSSPYSTAVTNLAAGTYTLSAVANDYGGAASTNSITITVGTVSTTNNILPVACAEIYSSGNVVSGSYLGTGANIRGGLEFAASDPIYSSVLLALNPYGLPMGDFNANIYGFDGGTGTLYGSNWYSGTLIGTIVFPANVTYGQVETLDVTRFVQSAKGPYFGFIIQAPGGDIFSSLNYNYGTPPQLIATLSTQPPTLFADRLGGQLVISWNTNQATGLTLQSNTNLVGGAPWTTVTTSPVQIGSRLVVTNPLAGPRQFFRLSNH